MRTFDAEKERLKSVKVAVEGSSPLETPVPNRSLLQIYPKWQRVARRWFEGEERWKARGYAATLVTLSLATTLMLVRISYVQRSLETAASEKDKVGFYKSIWSYIAIILFAAPLFAATDFFEARLSLEWRRWLCRELMNGYYANQAHFRLHQLTEAELDNPDQRICDDVPAFTEGSVALVIGLVRKVFNIVAFSGVLLTISPRMVLFLMLYTTVGTWLTTSAFGKRLMQLEFRVLQKAGDLRFSLLRTRENSESIAFYRGEAREVAMTAGRLQSLVTTARQRVAWAAGLSLWSNCYTYVTILMPSLLTAPRYFAGEVEFGVITQVGFAFRRIEMALNYLVDNLPQLSGLAAETERLDVLLAAMQTREPDQLQIRRLPSLNAGLQLDRLTVQTPGGQRTLCQALDLQLTEGQSILIMGQSGCGKSSLLRAIAGLWTTGSGTIQTPPDSQLVFLPQKPFMPLGTLRDQLLFPSGDWASSRGSREGLMVADAELLELLDAVCLPGLADRLGGLDAELEYAHVLSQGEQQRVAFLRLLLHRPKLAFLDEATGALDMPTESVLYQMLRQQCSSYVSVGHRKELLAFHTHVLLHTGKTQWECMTTDEFRRR